MLNFITWNANPKLFSVTIPFYWYYLLIAAGLLFVGWKIFEFINTKKEKENEKKIKKEKKADKNAVFYIIGILIVAAIFIKVKFPDLSSIGPLTVVWYGVLYAIGFLVGITTIERIFKHEKAPEKWIEKVFIYIILAEIVGARLGHCFFYQWDHYSQNLWEIPQIWKGGLASHGGAIGMLIAILLMSKYITKQNWLWLGDRIFVGAAFGASIIRFGNLMNSEIYGHPTNMPWGFVFVRGQEKFIYGTSGWEWCNPTGVYDEFGNHLLACHPGQLYEGIVYMLLFAFLLWLYWKRDAGKYNGLLAGIGSTWVFTARLFIELLKNPQVDFEENMLSSIGMNMGQMLSIPFIILGVYLIVRALKKGKVEYILPKEKKI